MTAVKFPLEDAFIEWTRERYNELLARSYIPRDDLKTGIITINLNPARKDQNNSFIGLPLNVLLKEFYDTCDSITTESKISLVILPCFPCSLHGNVSDYDIVFHAKTGHMFLITNGGDDKIYYMHSYPTPY